MRTWVVVAVILSVLVVVGSVRAEERFLDRLVAQVDGTVVTATDVALGRALGLFGLTPAADPLSLEEVQRYIDGQLLVREAGRIDVGVTPADDAEAWTAVTQRAGGEEALRRWLTTADVDPEWAHQLVAADIRMRRFVELRFRGLAFISETDLAAALGPGPHDEGAREAMRARLEGEAANRRLVEWLMEARTRASINPGVAKSGQLPDPLPGSPGVDGGS